MSLSDGNTKLTENVYQFKENSLKTL